MQRSHTLYTAGVQRLIMQDTVDPSLQFKRSRTNAVFRFLTARRDEREMQHRSLMAALANREKPAPQPAALV